MPAYRLPAPAHLLLLTFLGLAACQHAKPPSLDLDSLEREPPAAGGCVVATSSDWLSKLSSGRRRIEPAECSSHEGTPLFTWGQAADRQVGSGYTLSVRRTGGALVTSSGNLNAPRTRLNQALLPDDYEWSVSYRQSNGGTVSSQWRRFSVLAGDVTAHTMPDGRRLAAELGARARPRLLPAGSSFAALRQAASQGEHAAVLALLRSRARDAQAAALPANPDRAGTPNAAQLQQDSYDEIQRIQLLGLIGRLDGDASLLAQAKRRLLALAAWPATGVSGHQQAAAANQELVQALAYGLDLLWNELSATERNQIGSALRNRALPAVAALAEIDADPFELRRQGALRSLLPSLLLASGAPGFPEAAELLASSWEQSLHQLQLWSSDGSMGLGQAPAWYAFNSQVDFAAALRVTAGVDLYRLPALRRAGEQLIAFTPPVWPQRGAFGDNQENTALYAQYAPALYRLHAQLSRDPRDAWYWRADSSQLSKPSDASPWQLLLLGVNANALPRPQGPASHDWFSADAGLAALHRDISRGERSSLLFRASRFGAHLHAQADQNSLVYVVQGVPLLINSGYYPRFDSPHHRNTRATRYKNALTVDGGFGQGEPQAAKPGEPLFSMDAAGRLIRAQSQGGLSAITGDASAAYRQFAKGAWQPLLSNAVRSVVMDKANGLVLIYDWATSSQARQWELNFHSPGSFSADATTVRVSQGKASACLDRHGPATQFTQTMAWEVPPETIQPAQAHARFSALARSTEFAHLTVLREGCVAAGLQVQRSGTQISVLLDGKPLAQFDRRDLSLPNAAAGNASAFSRLPDSVVQTRMVGSGSDGETTSMADVPAGTAVAAAPAATVATAVATAPQSCRIEVWRNFGTQCRALAATVVAHGESVSFANTVAGYRGRISASCSDGVLSWSEGQCVQAPTVAARTSLRGVSTSSSEAPPDLSNKKVLVSQPPYSVLHRNGSRRVILAPYPRKDEVARTHDFVGAWIDPNNQRPNALTVQVPLAVNGQLKHVNLSEVSTPLFSAAGSPMRAALTSEGLRTAYIANDPSSSEKLRVQVNAYPTPTRQQLTWDLSLKFGGSTAAEAWPLTRYTTSPLVLWQLKVDPGFPSMGLMADTDPADPTKMMLVFFQRLSNVSAYAYRWTVNGLAPGRFHDVVISAKLDDREPSEGGAGSLRVWVNGEQVVAREGRNLIRDLSDAHRWAFGLYQAAESNPIPLNKVLIWRRARVLTDN